MKAISLQTLIVSRRKVDKVSLSRNSSASLQKFSTSLQLNEFYTIIVALSILIKKP
jgi:hypothetical protein